MSLHSNAAHGVIEVNDQVISRPSVPQCATCRSPHRDLAEAGLLVGKPPSAVAATLPDGAGLTARHLADHSRAGHLPAIPQLVAARLAAQESVGLAAAAASAVDETRRWVAFADAVLVSAATRLAHGDTEATIPEGLAAARLAALAESMPEPNVVKEQDWIDALLALVEAVKSQTDVTFTRIQHAADQHPVLRSLTGRPPLRSA